MSDYIVGQEEEDLNNDSAPDKPSSATPLQHSDCVITLAGAARGISSQTVTIDNALIGGRFLNNLFVPAIPEGDRIITLSCEVPYNSTNAALYAQAVAGATGSLKVDDGTIDRLLTFAKLQVPPESPSVGGKDEIPLNLNMVARKDGTTLELVVTDPV